MLGTLFQCQYRKHSVCSSRDHFDRSSVEDVALVYR
jgi:hypothetical protein